MKTKLVVAVVAIASLFILWQVSIGSLEAPVPVETSAVPAASVVDSEEVPADRQVIQAAPPVEPTRVGTEVPTEWLDGLVVDIDGHPVPDLEMIFERSEGSAFVPEGEPARSGPRGHFRLPLPANRGRLSVDDPLWATALHPRIDGASLAGLTIVVVSQSRRYAGRVVNEQGSPVAGARLDLDLPDAWGHELEALGEIVALPGTLAFTHSDESGAFEFPSVPFIGGSTLVALQDGYEPEQLVAPQSDREDLLFTLRSAEVDGLRGVVLDAHDRPVNGAQVSTGRNAVETGPDGRFTVDPPYLDNGLIWALKPGLGLASISFAENPQLLAGGADLILRLISDRSAIRGVLVDGEGSPVPGATIWTPDTTYFGNVISFLHGSPVRGMNTIEGIMNGKPAPALTVSTTTADDGSFEITGLTSRSYALFAFAERELSTAGPVYANPGADGVRLALSAGGVGRVSGRLLSRSGVPLAGVNVGMGRNVPWQRPVRDVDPWSSSPILPPSATMRAEESVAVTDEEGRFTTRPVQTEGAFLTFDGDAVFLARSLRLSDVDDLQRVEARADARSTFRVIVDNPGDADAFHLEGDDGRKQPLFMDVEQATMSTWNMPLVDGRSGIGYSSEGEVAVVLTRDDEEVRRFRVFLPAGGVHDLHL